MTRHSQSAKHNSNKKSWCALATCTGVIAVVWLGVLPALSQRREVRQRIELLEERGIDPSAMFYTELEVLDEVLQRADRFHRVHPDALWNPVNNTKTPAAPSHRGS